MKRFYLAPDQCGRRPIQLSGREAHHALRVLRVQPNERVVVLNGAGDEFLCEVQRADRRSLTLTVVEQRAIPAASCRVTLAQGVAKGSAMDTIVQKATELGAHRIVPILSERSVVRTSPDILAAKTTRWQTTAIDAIKQCGFAWLPRVEPPLGIHAFLSRNESFDLPLIASLDADAKHLRAHVDAFVRREARPPGSVCVWVGPEGDFSPDEVSMIRTSGALPISLGPLVLRSETAAIYCLSVINHEVQALLSTPVR